MTFFKNILIVCTGNICRSPYAEAVLQHFFQERQLPIQVSSAGIGALVDAPASQHTLDLLLKKGIDFSHHRARKINSEIMTTHDLIWVMEEAQQKFLHRTYPFSRGKVHLIGKHQNIEILDPYQKPVEAYCHMAKQLDRSIQDWVSQLFPVRAQPITL